MDARALVRSMAVAMALGLVVAGPVAGEQINLQARLTNAQGQPITTQTTVRLSIYRGGTANQAGSGTLVYDEQATVTPDASGVFNYLLGTTPVTGTLNAETFDTSELLFLEVKIGTTPLLPRQQIAFGARALSAGGLNLRDDQGRLTGHTIPVDQGAILTFNNPATGQSVALMGINTANFGFMGINGPTSSIARFTSNGNGDGFCEIFDKDGNLKITLDGVSGDITKTGTNGFRIDHPDDPARRWLTYVSLEGPETGIYMRGTARLVNGEATVVLPHHFGLVASPAGMTVQLTPRSAESEGLAVVELAPERLRVRELRHGTGGYEFDYMVQAVRKGYEGFDPESDKATDRASATAPAPENR